MAFRNTMARLKKLLLSRDIDLIEQGVEFVAAMDDPEIWDALLTGVTWKTDYHPEPRWRSTGHWGGLVPNKLFEGTKHGQPYHDLALTLLVCHCPNEKLRSQVDRLKIQAGGYGVKVPLERIPLDGLEKLPNLRELRLDAWRGGIGSLWALGECEHLERFEIETGTKLEDGLDGLGSCPSLKHVRIRAPLTSTEGLAGAPLQSLYIDSNTLADLRGLHETTVQHVEVRSANNVDVSGLRGCRDLKTLEFHRCSVKNLQRLGGLGIERLDLDVASPPGRWPTFPHLKWASFSSADLDSAPQPALEELHTLYVTSLPRFTEAFPALRVLRTNSLQVDDLEPLRDAASLRELELRHCAAKDMSALGSLTDLEWLSITFCRSVEALDELPATSLRGWDMAESNVLDLEDAPVRSVRGVGNLQGLQILALRDCTQLETLEGIEHCSDLRVVDLRGCTGITDVTPLAKLPELRLVALRDTGFHADNVPAEIAGCVTLAKEPTLERGVDKPKPEPRKARKRKKKIPVPDDLRAAWEAMVPMLATSTRAGVEELCDHIAATAPRHEIFDALLKPVKYERWPGFIVRGRLTGISTKQLRKLAVQRLIGAAPRRASRRAASRPCRPSGRPTAATRSSTAGAESPVRWT